ncbi:MAG: nitroreductase family deazaflavin-dependent oxidoreductase [Nakamurella sp.]
MRRTLLWLLKNTLNRWTIRLAKSGRGPFSLVRHVGRKSGARYETPIIVASVPAGFVVELTYGEQVNWYRNIVAAGGCELLVRGVAHRIVSMEPYPTDEGRRAFNSVQRLVLRLLRRREFRLFRVDGSPSDAPDPDHTPS